jgi:D-lactate dehydrogenase (cytochrome)
MNLEAPQSVVVYPSSTEDVVQIVKIATKHRHMPVMPGPGATSLEGHYYGVRCFIISLDFLLI